jgi:hypothetical protein
MLGVAVVLGSTKGRGEKAAAEETSTLKRTLVVNFMLSQVCLLLFYLCISTMNVTLFNRHYNPSKKMRRQLAGMVWYCVMLLRFSLRRRRDAMLRCGVWPCRFLSLSVSGVRAFHVCDVWRYGS